jgi:DNA invertase Pin-like site-specific DNA recombinase
MTTLAYMRVSCDKQDLKNQKLEILEYAQKNNYKVDEFIEIEISSRKDQQKRRIDELFEKLNAGEILITAELSRIGRSTGEVINIINAFIKKQVKFIAIKQNLIINGKHDLQSKVLTTIFSLLAEMERDLISCRTIEALKAKKAQGIVLGRPKGALGVSKLDDKKEQIQELLKHKVSKSAISRMLSVSRTSLIDFIKSRGLNG